MISKPYLAVVGPTASGKSALAMDIAKRCKGEIICCDSVQIYRGFDIGAASPTSQDLKEVPHHLFGVASWDENVDAHAYGHMARQVIQDVQERNRVPILVGGTGLYLRAVTGPHLHENLPSDAKLREKLNRRETPRLRRLLERLDPERAEQIHRNDRVRLMRALEIRLISGQYFHELTSKPTPVDPLANVIVLKPDRKELHQRIEERAAWMLDRGLIEEVQQLLASGVSPQAKPMQSIGYKQVCEFLASKYSRDELKQNIVVATRRYAKRQDTWFAKVPAVSRISAPSQLDILSIEQVFQ